MKIYIPRPATRAVSKDAYDSIAMQKGLDIEVIEVIAGLEDAESAQHRIRSRNAILRLARALNEPFFVTLDSDTALIGITEFYECFLALENDSKLGAVSLANQPVYDLSGHVDLACTMIRLDAVKDIQFRLGEGKCFECYALGIDLRNNGYKHRYLDNKVRIKSVKEVWNG